jgi:sentrin-specific protease 8
MYAFPSVVLYQHDLDSLSPGSWLTDSVLEFWLEYITTDRDMSYLGPSVVHLIRDSAQNIPIEFLDAKALNEKVILVPINDHQGQESGGSHWSLAVYLRDSNKWLYYDSMASNHNTSLAKYTCKKINDYLSGSFDFAQIDINQQKNNYDCGLYVILLSEFFTKTQIPREINFDSNDTRKRIINLIKQVSEKKRLSLFDATVQQSL